MNIKTKPNKHTKPKCMKIKINRIRAGKLGEKIGIGLKKRVWIDCTYNIKSSILV
jgi:hypothetical protein